MIEGVGCGWVEGAYHCCTRAQVVPAHKAFLFFSSEFSCIYIEFQGHSFTYTMCILFVQFFHM